MGFSYSRTPVTPKRGGVLWILSGGDDRRIFLGLKFSIRGFFRVGEIGKYFFVCGSILAYGNCARDTSGSQNRGVLSVFSVTVQNATTENRGNPSILCL